MLTRIANEVYIEPAEVLHITEDVSNNAVIKWKLTGGVAISDLTVTGRTAQEVMADIMRGNQ